LALFLTESTLLRDAWLTKDAAKLVTCLRQGIEDKTEGTAAELLQCGHDLFEHVSEALSREML
jgi:hypothetical protein